VFCGRVYLSGVGVRQTGRLPRHVGREELLSVYVRRQRVTLYHVVMLLAEGKVCSPEEFTCRAVSGECVPLTWMCDDNPDCSDESDEKACSKRTQPQKAPRRTSPSSGVRRGGGTTVRVHVDILC
jgi:hypothetical protein